MIHDDWHEYDQTIGAYRASDGRTMIEHDADNIRLPERAKALCIDGWHDDWLPISLTGDIHIPDSDVVYTTDQWTVMSRAWRQQTIRWRCRRCGYITRHYPKGHLWATT